MDSKTLNLPAAGAAAALTGHLPEHMELQGYCYGDRYVLLPELTTAFTRCGGWVLERRTISATAMEYRFEVQLREVVELYGALIALGLELTRGSHALLTELCTCRKHSAASAKPLRILTLRLEINFLADVTLHSVLMTGSGLA